jgi:hypothetical protein
MNPPLVEHNLLNRCRPIAAKPLAAFFGAEMLAQTPDELVMRVGNAADLCMAQTIAHIKIQPNSQVRECLWVERERFKQVWEAAKVCPRRRTT